MTKLKCWKKVNSFIWVKNGEKEALAMSQKGFEDKYTYNKSIKKDNGNFLIKNNLFPYTSKQVAELKAIKYMKENDKC